MNNEGKDLQSLMDEEANANTPAPEVVERRAPVADKMVAMNVMVPESLLKSLRMIAVHKDMLIRDLVTNELEKFAKREKKKMMEQMLNGS